MNGHAIDSGKAWNPSLYLKYGRERLQPAVDLTARLNQQRDWNPAALLDLGCGPGNSTAVLRNIWPHSHIIGLDNSREMLDKAKSDFPEGDWMLLDGAVQSIPGRYDLIFSNAAVQWMTDHPALFAKLKGNLKPDGKIAMQIPLFYEMPMGEILTVLGKDSLWSGRIEGIREMLTIHSPEEYYDMLSELFADLEIWVTDYIHVMESQNAILEMMQSTALKPYRARLDEKEWTGFENAVLEEIKRKYPVQNNGRVLFPFKRLFFIAK